MERKSLKEGRGRGRNVLLAAFFVTVFAAPLWAAYPDKPISLINPFTPGGAGDLGSRMIVEKMNEFLGQPVISNYKPGGGGSLAASFVAKSKPDGYTLLLGSTSPLVVSTILRKTDYKLEDFQILGIFAFNPNRIAVKADARWKTLREFVKEAKKSPGKLMVGSYGKFTTSHFVIEKLSKEAGIQLNHVPYKGVPEAFAALLGGHVDAAVTTGTGGLTDSPNVRVLAVAGEKRLAEHPETATFMEFGYPVGYVGYYFLCAPKGTPKEVVDRLSGAQRKVYEKYAKEIREGMKKLELVPNVPDPEEALKKLLQSREDVVKIASELGIAGK